MIMSADDEQGSCCKVDWSVKQIALDLIKV